MSEFDEDSDLKLTAKSRMFPITARKLFKNDDLFNFNDLNPKQIVPFLNSFPKARRYLADCPAFKKGKAYNIVNVQSCSLTKTTVVRDKETLRIRGSNDLVHPELDRGGSSNGETDVFDRHFVVSGQSELILKNLKLRGAWVGNTKIGFCSKCGYWYVFIFIFFVRFSLSQDTQTEFYFPFFSVLLQSKKTRLWQCMWMGTGWEQLLHGLYV